MTHKDWETHAHAGKPQEEDSIKEIGHNQILQPIIIHLHNSKDMDSEEFRSDQEDSDDNDVNEGPMAVPLYQSNR